MFSKNEDLWEFGNRVGGDIRIRVLSGGGSGFAVIARGGITDILVDRERTIDVENKRVIFGAI